MKILSSVICFVLGIAVARADDNQAESTQDKPHHVYVERYELKTEDVLEELDALWGTELYAQDSYEYHLDWNWKKDEGGDGFLNEKWIFDAWGDLPGNWWIRENYSWPADQSTGTSTYLWLQRDDSSGVEFTPQPVVWEYFASGEHELPLPQPPWEYCDVSIKDGDSKVRPDFYYFDNLDAKRQAQTKIKLQTGGKALSRRQNLFRMTGTAAPAVYSVESHNVTDLVFSTKAAPPIAPQNITLGELGQLGSDGVLYKMLPDNVTKDITPDVAGVDYYTFSVDATKHIPFITANGMRLDPDEIKATNCVGQKVVFALGFDPAWPENVQTTSYQWLLSGKYVNAWEEYSGINWNNYVMTICHPATNWVSREHFGTAPAPPYCKLYKTLDWPLKQSQTGAWWVSGGRKSAGCNAEITFNNGQKATVVPTGKFQMLKPEITLVQQDYPHGGMIETNNEATPFPLLSLGNGPMSFKVYISQTYPGKFGLTQLVKMEAGTHMILPPFVHTDSTDGSFWLDGSTEFYNDEVNFTSASQLDDAPGFQLIETYGYYFGDWKVFVRFTPDGSGSIPITLGRIDWGWSSWADQDIPAPYPQSFLWSIDPALEAVYGPTTHQDDAFPEWTKVKPNPKDQ